MAEQQSIDKETGEIVSGLPAGYEAGNQSLAVSLARAEVDQQIATARAMPRSIKRVVDNILTLATLDDVTAEECVYALPRGGKPIKGPSIRLAEIISSQWGNCRVGARVVHVDRFEKYVEAEGVFHDLETNTATTARVRRRISNRQGKLLDDDMILVTSNAAASIAKRNAILGGVPKAVWRKAYDSVQAVITGDVDTLVEVREKMLKAFAAFGVKPEELFLALDLQGIDDVGLEEIGTLKGMYSALKSGEATVEEMFTRPGSAAASKDRPKDLGKALDDLAEKKAGDGKPDEEPKADENPSEQKADPTDNKPQDKAATSRAVEEAAASGRDAAASATDTPADKIKAAFDAGAEAKKKGFSARALPGHLREKGRDAEAKAWQDGFASVETGK